MSDQMQEIVLAGRPTGAPDDSHFRLESGAIPQPGPGEILVRVHYMSLDPYMRGRMDDAKSYAAPVPIGGRIAPHQREAADKGGIFKASLSSAAPGIRNNVFTEVLKIFIAIDIGIDFSFITLRIISLNVRRNFGLI